MRNYAQPEDQHDAATIDEIEIGDIVMTIWGWPGRVYKINKGHYSLAVQYKMSHGYFTPDNAPRHYVFGYEIESVVTP
jgi:hypothetical protein